jgi:hypothetical protein
MRARYYNPAIRRFVNQDTLFGSIDPGISLNRFAFVQANPVSGIDPLGLDVIYLNRSYYPPFAGHAAILIGSEQTGWTYFSKYGYLDAFNFIEYLPWTHGDGINQEKGYPSFQDYLSDNANNYYDRAVYIKATLDQDATMLTAAHDALNDQSYYNALTYNCENLVDQTLNAAGIKIATFLFDIPNNQYREISKLGEPFIPGEGLPQDISSSSKCSN